MWEHQKRMSTFSHLHPLSAPVLCSHLPSTHRRCAIFAALLEQPSPMDKIPHPLPPPPFWDHQFFCLCTKSIPLVQKYALFPNLVVGGGGREGTSLFESYPGDSDGKESACSAGGWGSIPGSGRSPGEGNGWLCTAVFLLGGSHGQKTPVGYSPWSCKESDMTERLTLSTSSLTPTCPSSFNLHPFALLFLNNRSPQWTV